GARDSGHGVVARSRRTGLSHWTGALDWRTGLAHWTGAPNWRTEPSHGAVPGDSRATDVARATEVRGNNMKLTKHEHACVVLERDGTSIVIDPGSFSSGAAEIIAGAETILLTHEHFDHVNEAAVNEALSARPDLRVYAPAALGGLFAAHQDQFTAVAAGDELTLG